MVKKWCWWFWVNSNNLIERELLQTLEKDNLNDVVQQKLLREQNHELNITDDIELDLNENEARSSFRHPYHFQK
jgi:hypothetical protein